MSGILNTRFVIVMVSVPCAAGVTLAGDFPEGESATDTDDVANVPPDEPSTQGHNAVQGIESAANSNLACTAMAPVETKQPDVANRKSSEEIPPVIKAVLPIPTNGAQALPSNHTAESTELRAAEALLSSMPDFGFMLDDSNVAAIASASIDRNGEMCRSPEGFEEEVASGYPDDAGVIVATKDCSDGDCLACDRQGVSGKPALDEPGIPFYCNECWIEYEGCEAQAAEDSASEGDGIQAGDIAEVGVAEGGGTAGEQHRGGDRKDSRSKNPELLLDEDGLPICNEFYDDAEGELMERPGVAAKDVSSAELCMIASPRRKPATARFSEPAAALDTRKEGYLYRYGQLSFRYDHVGLVC